MRWRDGRSKILGLTLMLPLVASLGVSACDDDDTGSGGAAGSDAGAKGGAGAPGTDAAAAGTGVTGPDAGTKNDAQATPQPDAGTVAGDAGATANTIVDIAKSDPQFSTLVTALMKTGLDQVLADSTKKYTVFAPTNSAFPPGAAALPNLKDILLYHVVAGEVPAAAVVGLSHATTAYIDAKTNLPQDIGIDIVDGKVQLNDSSLTPAKVVTTDIKASNGIIHVIDKVLAIPTKNLAESAQALGFTTLVTAATANGLAPALTGAQPLTVFAPTNEAFAAVGQATLDQLQASNMLAPILLFHVLDGKVYKGDVLKVTAPVPTKSTGKLLTVNIAPTGVTLTTKKVPVTKTNVIATNGVIHVVSGVLLPE